MKALFLFLALLSTPSFAYITPTISPPVPFSSITGTALPFQITPPTQIVSGTSVDWSAGFVFSKTISSSTTFTFANTADGQTITFAVTDSNASPVTWPTVSWSGGVTPTQTPSKTDIYTFIKIGSVFYGTYVQSF